MRGVVAAAVALLASASVARAWQGAAGCVRTAGSPLLHHDVISMDVGAFGDPSVSGSDASCEIDSEQLVQAELLHGGQHHDVPVIVRILRRCL